MLSIRVSEDDYELLRNTSNGTRSVSALARDAIQRIIGDPTPGGSVPGTDNSVSNNGTHGDVETAVRSLDRKLTVLQNEVSRLSRTVAESIPARMKD